MNRTVITGVGVVAPNGSDVTTFWDNVSTGRVVIEDEPLMDELGLRCRGVARCRSFSTSALEHDETLKEAAGLSRFVQLGAEAARQAMDDASIEVRPERASDGGVIFASAVGGAPEMQMMYEQLTETGRTEITPAPLSSTTYDGIFLDALPGLMARRHHLTGPSAVLTTGCTAGLDALGLAVELVRHSEAPFVLVGAGESPLNGISYATLDVIGCLSRADGPVQRASRPFDATRAGFVISEGAAFVVVEDLHHAQARNAAAYVEVLGWGSSSNAHHMTDTAAAAIDYVNAHGSSTPQNDLFETNAIKSVFGARAHEVPISSLKSMVGHSLSSASLAAVVSTIGSMHRGVVPLPRTTRYPTPPATSITSSTVREPTTSNTPW